MIKIKWLSSIYYQVISVISFFKPILFSRTHCGKHYWLPSLKISPISSVLTLLILSKYEEGMCSGGSESFIPRVWIMLGLRHSWSIHGLVLVTGWVWACELILNNETWKDICWEIFWDFIVSFLNEMKYTRCSRRTQLSVFGHSLWGQDYWSCCNYLMMIKAKKIAEKSRKLWRSLFGGSTCLNCWTNWS